jgi:hypothetical protein
MYLLLETFLQGANFDPGIWQSLAFNSLRSNTATGMDRRPKNGISEAIIHGPAQ